MDCLFNINTGSFAFRRVSLARPRIQHQIALVDVNIQSHVLWRGKGRSQVKVTEPLCFLTGLASIHGGISTQGWFIGLMCAVALLTLIVLIACFVNRNKGGKYSGTRGMQALSVEVLLKHLVFGWPKVMRCSLHQQPHTLR